MLANHDSVGGEILMRNTKLKHEALADCTICGERAEESRAFKKKVGKNADLQQKHFGDLDGCIAAR
jgi:hypothetical protein